MDEMKRWWPLLAIAALGLLFLKARGGTGVAFTPRRVGATQYNNLEEWEIVRNEKGRIKTIRIHRDAHME